jgi:PIN domain nuclease of toxin-antitoxin system
MQIKLQLGKLRLNLPLAKVIESQQQTNGIEVLPIILSHVLELDNLPAYHRDPFDRLLIAQARVEDAVLISNDPIFTDYSVKLLW